MNHEDICIPFMFDGTHYEAVGFLKDGEESVTIKEACRRASEKVLSTEADCYKIFYFQHELPDELLEFEYLLTAVPSNSAPDLDVMFFTQWRRTDISRHERLKMAFDEWEQSWPCNASALVLRRA